MSGQTEYALLAWGAVHLRDLPWRRTRDPWAITVAEFMLQQTQVERVLPKYAAFMDAFPSVTACCAATLGDVLVRWQGLGYPRRAKALHALAGVCATDFDGAFPRTLSALMALPGVGPYTARAIMTFAYEDDSAAVVDTNIGRVLARRNGSRLTVREAQTQADSLVPPGHSWLWNQSLMELGATVCRARTPQCEDCPWHNSCTWRLAGGDDPAIGSAGVSSRQRRFEGSDRQGRGRLMRAVTGAPVEQAALPATMGWNADMERAHRVALTLLNEGLIATDSLGRYTLPG